MVMNLAYLGEVNEDIVDLSRPLIVTAAGYYKINSAPDIKTTRPAGRGDYQIIYVAAGKGYFVMDGEERQVPKGNMVIFRPGEPQIYRFLREDRSEFYWTHFTGSEADNVLDGYMAPRGVNVLEASGSPDYQWLFSQMIHELRLRRANYEDILAMDLRHILLLVSRYIKESSQEKDAADVAESAIRYFYENYSTDISIRRYAEEHYYTPSWFISIFKRITKMTPRQYIVSLRLTNAMSLMDSTNLNVSQIAAEVGYDNPLYFSRLFRKHTGMSPREYRNRKK